LTLGPAELPAGLWLICLVLLVWYTRPMDIVLVLLLLLLVLFLAGGAVFNHLLWIVVLVVLVVILFAWLPRRRL
jgi:hypothetical protein